MKTPREILLEQHQSVAPKLDAIRARLLVSPPNAIGWREMLRSLRWHLAALGAAWIVVLILNINPSPESVASVPPGKTPNMEQVWAAFQENRRLLLQYDDAPPLELPAAPPRRGDIQPEQMVV